MGKIYIKIDENNKVKFIHYMPFDEKYGLNFSEEELMQSGYLVDEIPEFESVDGKTNELHYSAERGFWNEYIDIKQSEEYLKGYDQAILDMTEV